MSSDCHHCTSEGMWSSRSPHSDQGKAGALWTGSWPPCHQIPRVTDEDKPQKMLRTHPGPGLVTNTPNNPAGTWLPLTASSVCTPYPQEGRLPSYALDGHMTFLQHTRAKMRTTEDNTGRGSLYLKHLSLGASGLSFTITGSLWLR